MIGYESKVLEKLLLRNHIDEVLKIESDTSNKLGLTSYGLPWSSEEFLCDKDGKWTYSTCILENDSLIAYLISSQWLTNIHGHRMAMSINFSTEKKINLQRALYRKQQQIVKKNSILMTTAVVPENNASTINFYKREGWEELNYQELYDFIKDRGIDCHIEDNILVDTHPKPGHPGRSKVLKFLTK